MTESRPKDDLVAPRLPVRASIYIAPDGTVHFGALFAELLSVAAALSGPTARAFPSNTASSSTATSDASATATA